MHTKEINVLVLAYMGDTIYEDYIRKHLIEQKIATVGALQQASLQFVSAKSQARLLQKLLEKVTLSEEEESVLKRARNYKSNSHPKNCDILTYKHATSLEALIGYLYLEQQLDRVDYFMSVILEGEVLC